MNGSIETRQATIERTPDDLLEVRYKSGETLDAAGLSEVLSERERMRDDGLGQAVLAVIPPDADLQLSLMTTDHYKGRMAAERTRFLAITASSIMHERMASLYFTYFPQAFRTCIFTNEEEARAWLRKCMREVPLN